MMYKLRAAPNSGAVRDCHVDSPVVRPAERAYLRATAQARRAVYLCVAERTEDFLFCRIGRAAGQTGASHRMGRAAPSQQQWAPRRRSPGQSRRIELAADIGLR